MSKSQTLGRAAGGASGDGSAWAVTTSPRVHETLCTELPRFPAEPPRAVGHETTDEDLVSEVVMTQPHGWVSPGSGVSSLLLVSSQLVFHFPCT